MEPIRILHVVPNMNSGGLENLIMNIYRNIDRSKVQFDFLVHYQERGFFDDEIEKLGGKIYRFSFREDHRFFQYVKELNQFFNIHQEYKVVHAHMASLGFVYLKIAKKHGVPVRIAHSHGTSYLKTVKGYIKFLTFKLIKYQANVYFACSTEAGKYLFGQKRKFTIIPNAIDLQRFDYNKKVRNEVRNELMLDDDQLVIGNIGRFNLQKNHTFLLSIFHEIVKKRNNTTLLLVGKGELEDEIKEKVKSLKLENKVKFFGLRKDVDRLYQAMDVFLMPSLFEGLPLTGIEAQASKLTCYFSDTITKEVVISDNVQFLPLTAKAEEWAECIISHSGEKRENVKITNEEFDSKRLAHRMQTLYQHYYERGIEEE